MIRRAWLGAVLGLVLTCGVARAGDDLKINPKLDYSSDSQDGPLIFGDHMDDGVAAGKPNYIIFYIEGCFNSKRQAQRTVTLYKEYKGRVQFVIVDLDRAQTAEQRELRQKHFRGYVPHVTILDKNGKAVYDQAGEVDQNRVAAIFEAALK